jgi:hypothetical protein
MVNKKITALCALATPATCDLVAIVDVTCPAATKKMTFANLVSASTATFTNKTFDQDGAGNCISNLANASIKSSAAIDFSKLAALTDGNILVGSACCVATSVAMSGDVAIVNSGATTIQANAVELSMVATAAKTESFTVALSDETTVLPCASTTVPLATFRMPYAFTVTDARASVRTVGTGAALVTVDIHESGTTILSTKLTIDASEKTSETAATARVISDSALADDALMEFFLDTRDTNNLATGLKVTIIGYQT